MAPRDLDIDLDEQSFNWQLLDAALGLAQFARCACLGSRPAGELSRASTLPILWSFCEERIKRSCAFEPLLALQALSDARRLCEILVANGHPEFSHHIETIDRGFARINEAVLTKLTEAERCRQ